MINQARNAVALNNTKVQGEEEEEEEEEGAEIIDPRENESVYAPDPDEPYEPMTDYRNVGKLVKVLFSKKQKMRL